jgi:hypothetical protein
MDDAEDEKKHVSRVQVEPDSIFYNSVAAVARQRVGPEIRIRCLPANKTREFGLSN